MGRWRGRTIVTKDAPRNGDRIGGSLFFPANKRQQHGLSGIPGQVLPASFVLKTAGALELEVVPEPEITTVTGMAKTRGQQ
jgi:hypothetical protein